MQRDCPRTSQAPVHRLCLGMFSVHNTSHPHPHASDTFDVGCHVPIGDALRQASQLEQGAPDDIFGKGEDNHGDRGEGEARVRTPTQPGQVSSSHDVSPYCCLIQAHGLPTRTPVSRMTPISWYFNIKTDITEVFRKCPLEVSAGLWSTAWDGETGASNKQGQMSLRDLGPFGSESR
jgi:hypothetical protein